MKMIVADLDGSLLRQDKSIAEYTKRILTKCQNRNIKVVFATARPERTTDVYADTIVPDAIISNNGAKITCDNKLLQLFELNPDIVRKAVAQLLNMDVFFCLDYETYSLTNCPDYRTWNNWNAFYTDFSNYDTRGVQKIAVRAIGLKEFLSIQFEQYDCRIYANRSDSWYMITDKHATKITALQKLSIYYKIPFSQMVAFGDDHNDIEMLQVCGIGVAMENSSSEVKRSANDVCPSNDNNGIAEWIAKNIL